MQFGIQMYTLRRTMDTLENFEKTLRRVSELGYENVQISPQPYISTEDMAKMLKKYHLKADSYLCDVYQIPNRIDEITKACRTLGTDVCRTNSIRLEDRCSVEGYRSFAEQLNRDGRCLKEKGLKFMYHFHSFEFVKLGDTTGMDILLRETDTDSVMFQPDVFWLVSAGFEPSNALEMFRGRAAYIHLKDYVIVPKSSEILEETKCASAPVGTGNLNWEKIIEKAKDIGITNFVVEDDMGVLDPFDSAAQSIQSMKRWHF